MHDLHDDWRSTSFILLSLTTRSLTSSLFSFSLAEVLKPPCSNSGNYDVPMFQTGSGKSVLVKQSSISRALSVLQAGDDLETGN